MNDFVMVKKYLRTGRPNQYNEHTETLAVRMPDSVKAVVMGWPPAERSKMVTEALKEYSARLSKKRKGAATRPT